MNRIFTLSLLAATALASALPSSAALPRRHARSIAAEEQAPAKRPLRVAKRATAAGSNIFGYLCYSDNEADIQGLYSLEGEGYELMWQDPLLERYAEIYTGWARNGVLHAVALMADDYGNTSAYNIQQDLYTGDLFEIKPVKPGGSYFTVVTLNQEDGKIYGVASQPDGGWAFSMAASGLPEIVTPICEADDAHNFLSLTYNIEDGKMYGINREFNFVTIATDGEVTVLAPVKLDKAPADYQTGIIFAPQERKFYWNVNYADETSALVTIDPVSYEFEVVERYLNCEEFAFFVSPDGKADPTLPAPPVFESSDFGKGALSGSVTFRLPTATDGGDPLPASIEWIAWLDNNEYSTGSGKPGESVQVSFTDLPLGRHIFAMSAAVGDKEGLRGRQAIFIGPDTPKAPAGVNLSADGQLTWQPVTEGVSGGYVNLSALRYHIQDGAGKELAVTSSNSWSTTLPADAAMKAYRFGVTAEYDETEFSSTSWSNTIVAGLPFSLPAEFVPTPAQALLFTTNDVNADGRGWIYDDGYEFGTEEAFKCYYGNIDSNDWLFMPAIDIAKDDKIVELSFDARLLSRFLSNEEMCVYAGTSPDPSSMKPLGSPFKPSETYSNYAFYYLGSGVTYFGIHCTSPAGNAGVAVRNFDVKKSDTSLNTPAAPEEASAMGAKDGVLKIRVDVTLPSKNIAGQDLPADAMLTAKVQALEAETVATAEGKPGSKLSLEVDAVQGQNTMLLNVEYGGNASRFLELSAYAGVAVPVSPTNVKARNGEDMHITYLSWDPVTTGVDGGYVLPENITYNVYILRAGYAGAVWEPVAQSLKQPSYTYVAPPNAAQEYLQFGIAAANEAGVSSNYTPAYAVVGTPYNLPMGENFAEMTSDDDVTLEPYVVAYPSAAYTGEWNFVLPSQISTSIATQEGYYLIAYGQPGAKARIGIPRFRGGSDVKLVINSMSCYGIAPVSIYAECDGCEPELIGSVPLVNVALPQKATFEIPAKFADKKWVQLYFDCELTAESRVACIRGYEVLGTTAVEAVEGQEDTSVTVSDLAGRVLLREADPAELSRLAPGLYIVNGRKVLINR